MTSRISKLLKHAFRSRVVYILVVVNLCFVAHQIGHLPHAGHGLAGCIIPKEEEVFGCYFPPPPSALKVVGIISNAIPLLASVFISETLETTLPGLCVAMTFVNLALVFGGVSLQWMAAGLAVEAYLAKRKTQCIERENDEQNFADCEARHKSVVEN